MPRQVVSRVGRLAGLSTDTVGVRRGGRRREKDTAARRETSRAVAAAVANSLRGEGCTDTARRLGATKEELAEALGTPEAWVSALGDAQHGFPYLSGAGRLVIKDVALLAGSWLVVVDCARAMLSRSASLRTALPAAGRTAAGARS
jgi:hypothetical protein